MQFKLSAKCTDGWTDLPMQPPVEVDKTWTITKTDAAYIITCNDVEALNFLFTDGKEHESTESVNTGP